MRPRRLEPLLRSARDDPTMVAAQRIINIRRQARLEIVTIEFDRSVSCSSSLAHQLQTAGALILFPTVFPASITRIFSHLSNSCPVKTHVTNINNPLPLSTAIQNAKGRTLRNVWFNPIVSLRAF